MAKFVKFNIPAKIFLKMSIIRKISFLDENISKNVAAKLYKDIILKSLV